MTEAVKTQITTMHEMVIAQTPIIGSEKVAAALAASVTSLCIQIKELESFDMSGVVEISVLLQRQSLPQSVKSQIVQSMNDRLDQGAAEPGKSKKQSSEIKQTLEQPHLFFSDSDIKYIKNESKIMSQCCTRAMERMRLIGLEHPSQTCFGNVAASLASVRAPDLTEDQLYDVVLGLKDALLPSSKPQLWTGCGPATPADLKAQHPQVYALAFTNDDPPSDFNAPQYRQIRARCFVRSSGKAIRATKVSGKQARAAAQPAAAGEGALAGAVVNLLGSFCSRFIDDGSQPTISVNQSAVDRSGGKVPERPKMKLEPGVETKPRDELSSTALSDEPRTGEGAASTQLPSSSALLPASKVDPKDLVVELEYLSLMKRPAAAGPTIKKGPVKKEPTMKKKRPAAAASGAPVKKRPSAAASGASAMKSWVRCTNLKLGCARCRCGSGGCLTCRSPTFAGQRMNRAQYLRKHGI